MCCKQRICLMHRNPRSWVQQRELSSCPWQINQILTFCCKMIASSSDTKNYAWPEIIEKWVIFVNSLVWRQTGCARSGTRIFPTGGLKSRIDGIFLCTRMQFSVKNSPTDTKFFPVGGGGGANRTQWGGYSPPGATSGLCYKGPANFLN